jgi:hypothetical protein
LRRFHLVWELTRHGPFQFSGAVVLMFEGGHRAFEQQVFPCFKCAASGNVVLSMVCEGIGDSANHKELWLYS